MQNNNFCKKSGKNCEKGIDKSFREVYNTACKGKGVFEQQTQGRFSFAKTCSLIW